MDTRFELRLGVEENYMAEHMTSSEHLTDVGHDSGEDVDDQDTGTAGPDQSNGHLPRSIDGRTEPCCSSNDDYATQIDPERSGDESIAAADATGLVQSSDDAVAPSSMEDITSVAEGSVAEHERSGWTGLWRDVSAGFDVLTVDSSDIVIDMAHASHTSDMYMAASGNRNLRLSYSTDGDDTSVDASDEESGSALVEAVEANDIDRVCVLLREGADVNRTYQARSPLCVAAQEGHTSLVDILLATNACLLDQPDQSDNIWHRHAVHYAAVRGHVDIVQKLIKSGVDINTRDADNRTPLHWAATSGWVNVAEFLIANGASVNIVQKDGFSALHAATCLGHMHMCRYLLAEGCEVNRTDRDGWSPLHMATCYGHPEVVRLFLSSGAKVNQKTRDEETALHIAVDPANLDIIGELIGAGARIEERNINGFTPFFDAVWRNKYDVCEYLINLGADVNVKNNAGHSAMYIATVRAAKRFMKLIVAAGCDLQSESWIRLGQVPVALVEHKELSEWLFTYACQPYTLQTAACFVIRKRLHSNVAAKVVDLPIPDRLKDFVALKYL